MLDDNIKELQSINKKIAKLTVLKEDLISNILLEMDHNHQGERSYEYKTWKITCKTPNIYSLETKLYKEGEVFIEDGFNPIKETVSYRVDKKLFEDYMTTGSAKVREALTKLVTVKPGKQNVIISEIGA